MRRDTLIPGKTRQTHDALAGAAAPAAPPRPLDMKKGPLVQPLEQKKIDLAKAPPNRT